MAHILYQGNDPVISRAANEFIRVLSAMGSPENAGEGEIKLGIFPEFGLTPKSENTLYDDEFAISLKNGSGYIAGSNPRSVLIAVYRYLELCGARWVRPGENGEYLPKITSLPKTVEMREAAAHRHRGICIEGAVGYGQIVELLDFMPKVGMNSYYIQFRDAFIFFDRFYSHRDSTVKQPEPFSYEDALALVAKVRTVAKERGLLLQAVGHGWTCEPFGVANHGWDPVKPEDIPDSYRAVCAEVKGVRDVWRGMPLATSLCYSNPEVRRTMVEDVVKYLKDTPEVDVLHFWLSDWPNNTCECEECRKYPPADFYMMMLNEIDERLTEEGIDARIVFLIYYDTMFTPVKERLKNKDRFILMFAPISRSFARSFPNGFAVKETPPFKINSFTSPSSVDENLAFLYKWEQVFDGDSFDFDYHLMWDNMLDAGGEAIARVLHGDIQNYDALGLHGLISCQLQRNSFPTSLSMTVIGRNLWDPSLPFEDIRRSLYEGGFGADAAKEVGDYLAKLSHCFDVGALRHQKDMPREELADLLREAVETFKEFAPRITAYKEKATDPCHRHSLRMLEIHTEIYRLYAEALVAMIGEHNLDKFRALQKEAAQVAWEHEDEVLSSLDCYYFNDITKTRVWFE